MMVSRGKAMDALDWAAWERSAPMKKRMLAFASASLSLFWLAVLLVSAKTEKAQFLGRWDSVDAGDGGNKTLSLIAGGPASSLLVRLYEDNTTATELDASRRPIQAASDMGRFSESAYALTGNLNLMFEAASPSLDGASEARFGFSRGTLVHSLATAWYPLT
jgi:hypothetical protein